MIGNILSATVLACMIFMQTINTGHNRMKIASSGPTPVAFYKICGDVTSGGSCTATSSTTVADSSGNGNNGTWNGTQSGTTNWYSSGTGTPYPFAGTFNGTDNFIQTTYTPTGITDFTAVVRVFTANPGVLAVPFSSSDAANNNSIQFWMVNAGAGTFNVFAGILNAGSLTYIGWNGVGIENAWNCLVMTHVGGAASLTLYVNGTAGGTVLGTAATNPGNGGAFYMGKNGIYTTPFFFPGLISDARFYTSVLTVGSIPGCI